MTRYAVAGRDPYPSRRARGLRDASPGSPRRLAYADPPYPGNAHLYRGHPDYAGEVDHAELLSRLAVYDGWALSTSARALPDVLALAVAQGLTVRVAAWFRGVRPHATARFPVNAWEPVIYVPVALAGLDASRGPDGEPSHGTGGTRRVDALTHGVSAMRTLPTRVIGAKPAAFCRWMFDLIGAAPDDTLDDLFPGSGIVSKAWAAFCGRSP